MDAFEQADAMVQVCSGIFGIVVVGLFVFFAVFRNKKNKK